MVMIVRYVDCRVPGIQPWGGPTQRYMEKDNLQNNQCSECEKRWEKEMWDVSRGKMMIQQCQAYRKDNSLLL